MPSASGKNAVTFAPTDTSLALNDSLGD